MYACDHFHMASNMAMWVPAPSFAPSSTCGSAHMFVLHSLIHGRLSPVILRPLAQDIRVCTDAMPGPSDDVRPYQVLRPKADKWRLGNAKLERRSQEVRKSKFRLRNAKLLRSAPLQPCALSRACTWDKPPLDGVAWWIEPQDWKPQQVNSDCNTVLDSASVVGDSDVDEEDAGKLEDKEDLTPAEFCSLGVQAWDPASDTPKPKEGQDEEEEWEREDNLLRVLQALEDKQNCLAAKSGHQLVIPLAEREVRDAPQKMGMKVFMTTTRADSSLQTRAAFADEDAGRGSDMQNLAAPKQDATPTLGGIFSKRPEVKKSRSAQKRSSAVFAAGGSKVREEKADAPSERNTETARLAIAEEATLAKHLPAPATSSVKEKRYEGIVKYFRGSFGWVVCELLASRYAGADVFIHKRDCDAIPKQGDSVTFVLDIDYKGNPKGSAVKISKEPMRINARDWFTRRALHPST